MRTRTFARGIVLTGCLAALFSAPALVTAAGTGSSVVVARVDDPVTLKYKWTKGAVLYYKSTQDTKGKMSVPNIGERETSQHQEMTQKMEIKDVAADGSATVEWTFLTLKLDADQGNGQKSSFDSTKPGDVEGNNPMVTVMGMMVGEHVTMVIEPSGAVKKVDGMNKILDKMKEKIDAVNPMAMRNLRNGLSDDAMRGSFSRYFDILPKNAVKAGDTWNSSFEQSIPGVGSRMKADTTWTLGSVSKSSGKNLADLKSTMKADVVTAKEGEDNGPIPGMKTTMKDGKGTGQSTFDVDGGQLVKSAMELTLPVEMAMQGMNIKNEMTTKITVEQTAAPAAASAPAAPAAEPKKEEPKKDEPKK